MSNLLGRYAALENDVSDLSPVDNVEVDEAGAPLDVSETAEQSILDAAEVEAPVIDEAEGEVDQLTEASESLEAWLDHVTEARREEGGLTRREAKGVVLGVANTLRPLGTNTESFIGFGQASCESFVGTKIGTKTLSLENAITSALQSIWNSIKNAINKLVTYVRDWYLKNWDSASRMKRKAEAIREKANKTNGTPKEKKTPVPGMAQLHVSKAVPTADQIVTSLDEVRGQASEIFSARQSGDYASGLDSLVDNIEKLKITETLAVAEAKPVLDAVGKLIPKTSKLYKDAPINADTRFSGLSYVTAVKSSKELCGGKSVIHYYPGGDIARARGDNSADVILKDASQAFLEVRDFADKKVEIDSSKEGAVLSTSQVAAICQGVIKAMDVIIDFKAAYAKHEKASKDFVTKMDKVVKKTVAEDDSDGEKNRVRLVRTTANAASHLIKSQNRTITSFTGYLLTTSRAALGYCNTSLNQYKSA
jgi:hypothetical protein